MTARRRYGTNTSLRAATTPAAPTPPGRRPAPGARSRRGARPRAACARHALVRGRLALLAGRVVRVAEQVDRRRPHARRRERRLGAADWPRLHEAAERLHRPERGDRRLAPQRVEHEVEAVAAGRLAERARRGRRRRAGTSASAPSSRARSSAASSRAAATTRPAPSSFAACTAIWPTTPLAPSTSTVSPGASRPRHSSASQAARPDDAEGDRERRVEAVGHRVAARRRDQRPLRERAERLRLYSKYTSVPSARRPDALLAGHVRRLVALQRERAGGDADVDGVHGRGERPRRRRRPRLGSGSRNSPTSRDGAVRVQDGGSHRAGYYDPPSRWTTPRSPTTSRASCPA